MDIIIVVVCVSVDARKLKGYGIHSVYFGSVRFGSEEKRSVGKVGWLGLVVTKGKRYTEKDHTEQHILFVLKYFGWDDIHISRKGIQASYPFCFSFSFLLFCSVGSSSFSPENKNEK